MSFSQFFFRLKSFSVLSQDFRHKLSRLPLRQGSLPKSKPTSGNNFLRRICQWRTKVSGSPKSPVSWKKCRVSNLFVKKSFNFFFGVGKWNVGNHLKRVFPKFEAERSHPRGVNGRSKFAKIFRFFVRPFTTRGWLRSARNFGKTRFRWFPTFHFPTPKKHFGRIF